MLLHRLLILCIPLPHQHYHCCLFLLPELLLQDLLLMLLLCLFVWLLSGQLQLAQVRRRHWVVKWPGGQSPLGQTSTGAAMVCAAYGMPVASLTAWAHATQPLKAPQRNNDTSWQLQGR